MKHKTCEYIVQPARDITPTNGFKNGFSPKLSLAKPSDENSPLLSSAIFFEQSIRLGLQAIWRKWKGTDLSVSNTHAVSKTKVPADVSAKQYLDGY